MTPGVEAILPVALPRAARWLSVTCWPLPGVSEEAGRYFIDSAGADPGGDRRLYPAASAAGARAP
ncbi:hypothetical protein LNO81_19465 [Klebsiella variicola subsp. variicola]|nr:hypothetical protein [Klebsiella variicola subsp. variicola]